MRNLIVVLVIGMAVFGSTLTPAQIPHATGPTSCGAAKQITGYFEGTATSRQVGILNVVLNLSCDDGHYTGELTTPVGKFEIISGTLSGSKLFLTFSAGDDKGRLEAEAGKAKLQGHFVFGDDSGPIEMVRTGDAKQQGYDRPTLELTATQWREDLHYFAREVPKQHANAFHHLSREAFDAAVARADGELGSANGDEAYVAIDRIANAIGDGHTFVIWPDDLADVPLDIRMFDGVYRVAGVLAGNEHALGARIVKVGDVPLDQVLEKLRALTPAAETRTLDEIRIEDFLSIGMLLHGLDIIPDRNVVTYTLADESGKPFTITLHGMSMDDFMMLKWVRPFRERPLYLQNRDSDLWCEVFAKSQTMYCSFRGYGNLAQNAAQLLSAIQQHHPKKLAIDMRSNLGGDYTLGQKYLIEPLRALPDINKQGHLFVLISPYTFSAGMSNAAQFRSETQAILAGQTIGERPNSYQEARAIRLPNSHLVVRVSTKHYTFVTGEENLVRPDKEIRRTWEDYKAGRDAVLEWVEKY